MEANLKELKFLLAVWKANLQSVMEYRVAFLLQAFGMMINNAIYFLIWMIYFDRFKEVRGWGLNDMFVTYGIIASGFGLVALLFGNTFNLGDVITKGRLDYYLSMPRPVLLHTVASRSIASGMGDFTYGFVSYALSGRYTLDGLGRFIVGVLCAAAIFAAFMILIQSLAFWIGNTSYLSSMAVNAILAFAIYPITLFDNTAKLILLTLIPAALMGALPAQFVHTFSWVTLAEIFLGAAIFLGLAVAVFRLGLRRYESGSGIQVEV
jgi:ABC-2 type transport system permease protein